MDISSLIKYPYLSNIAEAKIHDALLNGTASTSPESLIPAKKEQIASTFSEPSVMMQNVISRRETFNLHRYTRYASAHSLPIIDDEYKHNKSKDIFHSDKSDKSDKSVRSVSKEKRESIFSQGRLSDKSIFSQGRSSDKSLHVESADINDILYRYKPVSNLKCCICSIVKDAEAYLPRFFENVYLLTTVFDEYAIILYCDISSDKTIEIIREYQENNVNIKCIENRYFISDIETHRNAYGRNRCIHCIRKYYPNYNYFIMMSCGDIGKIKPNVLKYFLKRNDWDALTFASYPYDDIYSLTIKPLFFNYGKKRSMFKKLYTYINKLILNTNPKKLIVCESAFNNFAIYRLVKFINCKYDGRLRLDLMPKALLKRIIRTHEVKTVDDDKSTGRLTNVSTTTSAGRVTNISTTSSNATRNSRLLYIHNLNNTNLKLNTCEDSEHRSFHMEAIRMTGARFRLSPVVLFE